MPTNLLDKTSQKKKGRKGTNSARKAAKIWSVSPTLVTNAIEAGTLWPQSVIKDEPDDKPAYGFHLDYIKEVLELLPPPEKRANNTKVFNSSIKQKMQPINIRWKKKYPKDDDGRFIIDWPR